MIYLISKLSSISEGDRLAGASREIEPLCFENLMMNQQGVWCPWMILNVNSLSNRRNMKTRTRKWHQRARRKRSHLRTRGEVELFWMRARMSRWRMMMPSVLRSPLICLKETKIMIFSPILFSSRRTWLSNLSSAISAEDLMAQSSDLLYSLMILHSLMLSSTFTRTALKRAIPLSMTSRRTSGWILGRLLKSSYRSLSCAIDVVKLGQRLSALTAESNTTVTIAPLSTWSKLLRESISALSAVTKITLSSLSSLLGWTWMITISSSGLSLVRHFYLAGRQRNTCPKSVMRFTTSSKGMKSLLELSTASVMMELKKSCPWKFSILGENTSNSKVLLYAR